MANNHYDGTGVLVLKKVTPVIAALFGGYALGNQVTEEGQSYIALISESNTSTWAEVLDDLHVLANSRELDTTALENEGLKSYLRLLAPEFGAQDDPFIQGLDEVDPDSDTELETLFSIAQAFNDGHDLEAIKFEGCWSSDRPRLFEFGGNGEYIGRNFSVARSSTTALTLGSRIDGAINSGALNHAADAIIGQVNELLDGIINPEVRAIVLEKVADHLTNLSEIKATVQVVALHSALPILYKASGNLYKDGRVMVTSAFVDDGVEFMPDVEAGIYLTGSYIVMPDGSELDVVESKEGLILAMAENNAVKDIVADQWVVEVCRTGYGVTEIEVNGRMTQAEAERIALEEAGNIFVNERSSDYSVNSSRILKHVPETSESPL